MKTPAHTEPKLILIGPQTGISGGAKVAFNQLLGELDNRGVSYSCIDMPGGNYPLLRFFLVFRYLLLFGRTIKKESVISLHASDNSAMLYTLILDLFARATGSKLLVRVFGGRHMTVLKGKNRWLRSKVVRCYKRHTLLLETKELVRQAAGCMGIEDAVWFPNARPPARPKRPGSFNLAGTFRMLYIGQVRRAKGIDSLLELAGRIRAGGLDAQIVLYGQLFEEQLLQAINAGDGSVIRYEGLLAPEQVYDVMRQADLLLFPSTYAGEGYPGVIVEALNVQLPVLAADHGHIRDLIEPGVEGSLYRPGAPSSRPQDPDPEGESAESLWRQFREIYDRRDQLLRYHENMAEKRELFLSSRWNGEVFLQLAGISPPDRFA